MKNLVETKWLGKMAFETDLGGHSLIIDADQSVGGENRGPRPKPLMLAALAGCTAMDVISLLTKMRIPVDYFNVKVEGDITEEHPKHYYKVKIVYEVRGKNIPLDKVQHAINLSQEKYCGVMHVYKRVMDIETEIKIN